MRQTALALPGFSWFHRWPKIKWYLTILVPRQAGLEKEKIPIDTSCVPMTTPHKNWCQVGPKDAVEICQLIISLVILNNWLSQGWAHPAVTPVIETTQRTGWISPDKIQGRHSCCSAWLSLSRQVKTQSSSPGWNAHEQLSRGESCQEQWQVNES